MRLMEYLPELWRGTPEMVAIQGALDPAVDAAWAARDALIAQVDVTTATWGLANWEQMLGLAVDASKSDSYRRTRVMSKLRGQGTTTAKMLKNVAESFSNGEVEVIEHPAECGVDLKFVGTIGVPPNMDDLTAAVEEVIPAHLSYRYIIQFRPWGQLARHHWGALAARTWGEVKGGEL